MNANELVLTEKDVPRGFKLQEASRDHAQAHRVYGKPRFLAYSDAVWSEATVFDDTDSASEGWRKLVDFHKSRNDYDDVQEVPSSFGDETYVHSGTMGSRPGLWAAVRVNTVVHRFNTYGVDAAVSLKMLQRQVTKASQ